MHRSTSGFFRLGVRTASLHASRGAGRRGFTLIELLVVVALIGILAAVLGFSLSGGSQATSLENAQRNVMAMIQAAKANAALEGAPARLIIYADTNSQNASSAESGLVNSKALRYYGIIYGNVDPSTGNVTSWTAANEGAYLPSGIYFAPNKISQFATNISMQGWGNPSSIGSSTGTSPNVPRSHTIGVMQLTANSGGLGFPAGNVTGSDGQGGINTYYYIEFEPNGVFSNPNTANLVISAGNATSDGVVDFGEINNNNLMLSGVQVRFLGTAPFTEPADITATGN
jgi:type II secretion system protein H